MNQQQTQRLQAVRDLIASPWGEDHFDLGTEQVGDLANAFEHEAFGCGAAALAFQTSLADAGEDCRVIL